MQFIDSHCHFFFEALQTDLDGVMERAQQHGVNKMINVGTSITDSEKAVEIALRYENVWASVGAHPHDGAEFAQNEESGEKLISLSKREKVVAIGEIGLDYFKDYVGRDVQKKILESQLKAGSSTGLPFIFHVRDAWDDFWVAVDRHNIRGVIHSFSADEHQLKEALKRGFYIGLNGIMTFSKNDDQLNAAKNVPLNKLLLETDAPFLAPKPFRGQPCEPMHLRTTAEFLAELRGESLEQLAEATTINAQELFGI